jgi:predicted  nucleic acid-binding Zn-ribbon protein
MNKKKLKKIILIFNYIIKKCKMNTTYDVETLENVLYRYIKDKFLSNNSENYLNKSYFPFSKEEFIGSFYEYLKTYCKKNNLNIDNIIPNKHVFDVINNVSVENKEYMKLIQNSLDNLTSKKKINMINKNSYCWIYWEYSQEIIMSEVNDLKKEISAITSNNNDDLKTKVSNVDSRIKHNDDEINDLKSKVSNVDSRIKHNDDEIEDLKSKVSNVDSRIKHNDDEIEDLKSKVSNVDSRFKHNDDKIEDLKSKVSNVVSRIKNGYDEVGVLKTRVLNIETIIEHNNNVLENTLLSVDKIISINNSDLSELKENVLDINTVINYINDRFQFYEQIVCQNDELKNKLSKNVNEIFFMRILLLFFLTISVIIFYFY